MSTFEVKNTEGKERADNPSYTKRGPEEAQADGQFLGGIEVAQEEDKVGNETALEDTHQSTRCKKSRSTCHGGLAHRYNRPKADLHRNPSVGADFFRYQLRRQLSDKERRSEDRISVVVI